MKNLSKKQLLNILLGGNKRESICTRSYTSIQTRCLGLLIHK